MIRWELRTDPALRAWFWRRGLELEAYGGPQAERITAQAVLTALKERDERLQALERELEGLG